MYNYRHTRYAHSDHHQHFEATVVAIPGIAGLQARQRISSKASKAIIVGFGLFGRRSIPTWEVYGRRVLLLVGFRVALQLIEAQKQVTGRLEHSIKELQEFAQQCAPGDGSDGENLGGIVKSQLDDQSAHPALSHTTAKHPSNCFKVLHIPANGKSPQIISLPTIDVDSEGCGDANLSRLPDLRSLWGKEGWLRRQYFRITFSDLELAEEDINAFYYIFMSDDERSLLPNPHFAAGVCGDVCIMRQANYSSDEEGSTTFADISENVLKMKHWRTMFKHAIEARKGV
ncbi:hypothetical protein DL98DRAFT_266920 [Cadophora sp. DSE1049]|nr:hypothetical protein DL98DRAFT_266920 [Cadophora sp. DSE1049]